MKKWPEVTDRAWTAKSHTTVKLSTKLSCGYEIEETFRGRTADDARKVGKRILKMRVEGHQKWCKGPQSH